MVYFCVSVSTTFEKKKEGFILEHGFNQSNVVGEVAAAVLYGSSHQGRPESRGQSATQH